MPVAGDSQKFYLKWDEHGKSVEVRLSGSLSTIKPEALLQIWV